MGDSTMRTEFMTSGSIRSESGQNSKTATIQIRLSEAEMAVLNAASQRLGVSKSALLREHGLAAAQEVLEEERRLSWSDEAYKALTSYLDRPAHPNAEMVEMMSRRPIWDRV